MPIGANTNKREKPKRNKNKHESFKANYYHENRF
jgi:hypothetical protein